MKHTKEDTRKYNLNRKAAEHYDLFTQMLTAGALLSAYRHLGDLLQSIDRMEPEQRRHYRNVIAGHKPTAEALEALRPAYEHDYQRALQLVQFSPNLLGEEISLIRRLRDKLYSVYNLFHQNFFIPLMPLTELDDAIHKNLERYYRNRRRRS